MITKIVLLAVGILFGAFFTWTTTVTMLGTEVAAQSGFLTYLGVSIFGWALTGGLWLVNLGLNRHEAKVNA